MSERNKRRSRRRRTSSAPAETPRKNSSNPILSFLNVNEDQLRMMEIIGLCVCITAVLCCAFIFGSKPPVGPDGEEDINAQIDKAGKGTVISENIYIEKTPLKGSTLEEAEEIIRDRAEHTLGAFELVFAAEGSEYTVGSEELGIKLNTDEIVKRLYEEGTSGADSVKHVTVSEDKYVYEFAYTADEAAIAERLSVLTEPLSIEPSDAKVDVKKSKDEDRLQVSGRVSYTEEIVGRKIDTEALASKFMDAIKKGDSGKVCTAEFVEVQPSKTLEQIKDNFTKMASFTTTFKDSNANRRYNVWKMADVVNGIVLEPGRSWSINEAAGPRYEKYGWKEAAGIIDGAYTEQFGGGICQVSSTLYNAAIRAELKILKRSHHSWPVKYVPLGLDATISTGSPDFVFENPYDVPIVVIVNCDARSDKKITVTIYGPERDYTVDFESEVVSEEEPSATPKLKLDASVAPGKTVVVKERKNKIVVEVYKYKYDKHSHKQIGERELFHTDTYKSQAGEYHYGPSATPAPTSTPKPSSTPKPTSTPMPTPVDTPEPSKDDDEPEG